MVCAVTSVENAIDYSTFLISTRSSHLSAAAALLIAWEKIVVTSLLNDARVKKVAYYPPH